MWGRVVEELKAIVGARSKLPGVYHKEVMFVIYSF
jgi:hypothetical protein